MRETWVQSLGWEDPLEKEIATHSSILAWRIPRTEESGRLQSTGSQKVGHDWVTNLGSILKSKDITLLTKLFFSSSHLWMWELDHKEGWTQKNWCFQTVVPEKTLESPLDCKEIKPVNPKGNQSWLFIGKTDAEAEAPILWPPDTKSWLVGKTLMLGKIEGRRRREGQRMIFYTWKLNILKFLKKFTN